MQSKVVRLMSIALVLTAGAVPVKAETTNIALRAGESADLKEVFYVVNCRSLLTAPMTVEMLEGLPGLTASIRPAKVVPHIQNCAKPVEGGQLELSAAKDVSQKVEGDILLRVKYSTADGERQKAYQFHVFLLP